MIYPINYISITQGHHDGLAIDFGWCGHHNQDILSVDDGVVYKTEYQSGGGNVVFIKHNTGIVSCYAHLKEYYVKKGQKVKKGQVIAKMGATGKYTTGEHLHFQLSKKGSNIYKANLDPLNFLQVQQNQNVANSGNTLKFKDKIMYAPDNELLLPNNTYRLLVSKAIRTIPKLSNNIVKVKDCRADVIPKLTSIKPNDDAYLNVGSDNNITEIIRESNGRVWGKLRNCYIVLENKDGTMQCEKLR